MTVTIENETVQTPDIKVGPTITVEPKGRRFEGATNAVKRIGNAASNDPLGAAVVLLGSACVVVWAANKIKDASQETLPDEGNEEVE